MLESGTNLRPRVRGENAAYRSGLVLGLTMAETMLLLLFALLLIVGATWEHARRQISTLQPMADAYVALRDADGGLAAVERLVRDLNSKQAELDRLAPLAAMQKELEDVQREMRRLPPNERTPAAIAEKLQQMNALGPLPPAELAAAAQLAKDIKEALPGVPPQDVLAEMRAAQEVRKEFPGQSARQVAEAAKALPLIPGEKPTDAIARLARENANYRGQNIELSRRIQAERKGNQFPSCWATPDGREEAIFEIVYNETGIEVWERPLPHRDADRRLLPLQNVRYERTLSPSEFRSDLMPLYRWSVENNCRFHVTLATRGKMDREHQNPVNAFFYPASSIRARQQ